MKHKKVIFRFIFIFLITSSFGSKAQEYLGWSCRNEIEVMCSKSGCGVSQKEEFTPVDVTLLKDGSMDVCAYSGCWSGRGTVTKLASFTIFTGEKFKFSSPPGNSATEDISVVVDERDNVAVMKNSVFAQPLICNKIEKDKPESISK